MSVKIENLEARRLLASDVIDLNTGLGIPARDVGGVKVYNLEEFASRDSAGGADVKVFQRDGVKYRINGTSGPDHIQIERNTFSATGTMEVNGSGGNDTIFGGRGVDIINGDSGNDVIRGYGANDILRGGAGDDYIRGGYGNDRILGDGDGVSNGRDKIYGEAGNDIIQGNGGRDTLYGGDGDDDIYTHDTAGFGSRNWVDQVDGGAGSDESWKSEEDIITAVERVYNRKF